MQTIEYIKLSKLKLHPNNPRIIKDEQFKKLCQSIKDNQDYFETRPILCNPDMVIFAGNMRYRAAKEIGLKEVPVAIMDIPEERQRELMIRDNRENGAWDFDLLSSYFETEELIEWGFEAAELFGGVDVVEPEETEGDDDVPVEVEPKTKRGDIYILGDNHRVMCGDSTIIDEVDRLMDGKKADMVFTDPPYGVDYEGKTADNLKIKNDTDTNTFLDSIVGIKSYLKEGGAIYVCCPPGNKFYDFIAAFRKHFRESCTIVWNKSSMVLGHGDYHYKHEPIIYGWNNGTHKWYGDRCQTTVWDFNKPNASKLHPTMKPIELIVNAIINSSLPKHILYEPFCGAGSTLIACEKTTRVCYGIEIDEHYCDVIVNRYVDFCKKNNREWSVIRNGKDISSEFNHN